MGDLNVKVEKERFYLFRSIRALLALAILFFVIWLVFMAPVCGCPDCKATGRVLLFLACPTCKGSGKVSIFKACIAAQSEPTKTRSNRVRR